MRTVDLQISVIYGRNILLAKCGFVLCHGKNSVFCRNRRQVDVVTVVIGILKNKILES